MNFDPNILIAIIIIMTVILGGVAIRLAITDGRADREHRKWMERNELRRRRTRVEIDGIHRGYRGMGLDGRADHTGAIRKHTRP